MPGITNELKDEILGNHFVAPTGDLYLALFDVEPDDDGSGATEITGLGYNRVSISFTDVVMHESHNNAIVPMPLAQADWGPVGGIGIMNSLADATGMKAHAPIRVNGPTGDIVTLQILEDDTLKFPSGAISVAWL